MAVGRPPLELLSVPSRDWSVVDLVGNLDCISCYVISPIAVVGRMYHCQGGKLMVYHLGVRAPAIAEGCNIAKRDVEYGSYLRVWRRDGPSVSGSASANGDLSSCTPRY